MIRLILDIVGEYYEALKKQGGWIGNERMQEIELEFNEVLVAIIDARIKAIQANNIDAIAPHTIYPSEKQINNIISGRHPFYTRGFRDGVEYVELLNEKK